MSLRKFIFVITLFIIIAPQTGWSQTTLDSLLMDDEVDYSILSQDSLLLDELDSISIFTLLDSILTADYRKSTMMFHLSYTSDVINAGRDFGVDQQGLSPAISYFHKSGVFGSLSGYWSSELDPNYSVTVASLGYLGIINSKLSYSMDFEHSFFSSNERLTDDLTIAVADAFDEEISVAYENPLTNNIGGGLLLDLGKAYTSFDYSFFFGNETAHRFEWNVVGNFTKKGFLFFDRVRVAPGFSVLFGNQEISTVRTGTESNTTRFVRTTFQSLDRPEQLELISTVIQELGDEAFFRRLEPRQKLLYINDVVLPIVEDTLENLPESERSFGLMNYNFRLPVYFRKNNWNFSLSYNYNIPQELPGEDLDLSPSGYLAIGLSYYLNFK